MKKLYPRYLFFFLILMLILPGCRKGEDDPFLSLRSRTKRLCGDWTMTEFREYHYDGSDSAHSDMYEVSMKDGQGSVLYKGNVMENFSFNETWKFEKDGNYQIESLINGAKINQQGVWTWSEKDKNSGYRKKECIYLTIKKYSSGTTIVEYSGRTMSSSYIMALRCISNKVMIFKTDESQYILGEGYRRVQAEYKLEKTD